MCFHLKTPHLIYIIGSLTLNPQPRVLQLIPEQGFSKTYIFSLRYITAFLLLGILGSTSALSWGGGVGSISNSEISKKKNRNAKKIIIIR